MAADAADIAELVSAYAAEGLLLPRSAEDIEEAIEDYVVVVDTHDRVRGCAALHSYSPSIAEVASVAVERSSHGSGLGGLVVRAVEAMARQRGHREVFAVTRAEQFFDSLGYGAADLAWYPEKRLRYDVLRAQGVPVEPKPCMRKVIA